MGDKVDQFRAIIRASATESSQTISNFINNLFEFVSNPSPPATSKILTYENFEKGILYVKEMRRNFKKSELVDIFEECDEDGISTITIEQLIDFCQRSVSRARSLALKLRKAIRESCRDVDQYTKAFASISGNSKYANPDNFRDFAEDMLQGITINESDALALYSIFDTNGDGKLTLDDFLGFIQPIIPDASRILESINPECIVDIKVSVSKAQDSDLIRQGYQQINSREVEALRLKSTLQNTNVSVSEGISSQGTFGKGQSIWIWRAKQGTCSGKLRPIIDIQLDSTSSSTAMVISGYTCLPISISGQWVWIKRAITPQEELDSIIDLQVTTGKMNTPTDKIWMSPGAGWIRVDGNWSKGFLSSYDSFVWFMPARERSISNHMSSPVRSSIFLSDEDRQNQLLFSVRYTLRHYVPLESMKQSADPFFLLSHRTVEDMAELRTSRALSEAEMVIDLGTVSLFHRYSSGSNGVLTLSKFQKMLSDIGLRFDRADYKVVFHYFDIKQDKSITREEYSHHLSLTDYELDHIGEIIKEKLRISLNKISQIKHNRMIHDIFRIVNTDGGNILSLAEVMALCARFHIFITEEEARKFKALLDIDHDDKVTEKDFIQFMKKDANISQRSAARIRESAALLRRWLLRGNINLADKRKTNSIVTSQWKELALYHERSYGTKFPGYLIASDYYSILSRLGCRLAYPELKQLTMVISPESSGRILQSHLEQFMSRQCRSFGELIHLLEIDILKPMIDVYKELKKEKTENTDSDKIAQLTSEYDEMLEDVVKHVQEIPKKIQLIDNLATNVDELNTLMPSNKSTHTMVSISQVKDGIEQAFKGYDTPQNLVPNLEEWVCLACLTGSIVFDDQNYGVNIKLLIEGLCSVMCGGLTATYIESEITVEMICRDIYRMIMEEVRMSNPKNKKDKSFDYTSAFSLFDEDGSGTISTSEFQSMLIRLQLIDLLPEGKISTIISKFDLKNKGYITLDDFKTFVETYKNRDFDNDGDDDDFDASDDGEEEFGLSSNTPPAQLTKNSDLDWFVWYIYKEACKVDPVDPESVITDFERACVEVEILDNAGSTSKKELWNLLYEFKLKGNMSNKQYESGIAHLSYCDDKKSDEIYVDFESLCRYIVRMGRAYNSLIQEKKKEMDANYQALKTILLQELTSMVSNGSKGDNNSEVYRYEKVFRRMDTDGDGRISVKEFKIGLRRLKIKNEKKWTFRLIRRLFDDCDKNGDGLISLREFTSMIKIWKSGSESQPEKSTSSTKKNNDGDDDEDDSLFRKERLIYDSELFKKISSNLLEVVPPTGDPKEDRIETVKSTVRKFFQKSDPDGKNIVSEEKFRAFCRRSGLQEVLTASELRFLLDKLKVRRGRTKNSIGIEYERFLHLLSKNTESIAHSRGEVVLQRIQDAVEEAAIAGRPFLALCSLVDQKLTGYMSSSDLIHTFKMMGITVTIEELKSLQELLPASATSNDGNIDYRQIFWLIQKQSSGMISKKNIFDSTIIDYPPKTISFTPNRNSSNPFLVTSTPILSQTGSRFHSAELDQIAYDKSIVMTPDGTFMSTPLRSDFPRTIRDRDTLQDTRHSSYLTSQGFHTKQIMDIIKKVVIAIEEKSIRSGVKISLSKQFEVYDNHLRGYIPLRIFQIVLDDLGVILSPSDIHVIRNQYGRPEDDSINYVEFYQELTRVNDMLIESSPRDRLTTNFKTTTSSISLPPASRMSDTLRSLKQNGKNPRDIFQAYDLDNTGMIDVRRFREIVQRLDLLQTSNQLNSVIDNFSSISDRNLICYEDFCRTIETHAIKDNNTNTNTWSREKTFNNTNNRSNQYDRDYSYGGSNGDEMNEKWYQDSTPRDIDQMSDSLDRFRSTMESKYDNIDQQRFSSSGYLPPKPSDSVSRLRLNKTMNYDNTYGSRDGIASLSSYGTQSPRYTSPLRNSNDRLSSSGGMLNAPRSPPSKVGSVIWGNETPLSRKGNVPKLDDCWVCSVCYFTENPHKARFCEICQSANYNDNKEFQIKQQCSNCTFLNGHFAKECEMCGDKL